MTEEAPSTEDGPLVALLEACERAGGQTALARTLGLGAQSTVSSWIERGAVPPMRVLAVEAATGVSRHRLRPDLYPPGETRLPSLHTNRVAI